MATNILAVPFRRTRAVALGEGLKEFIQTTLDQHPEQFRDDSAAIDKLRADSTVLDVHPNSLDRLLQYHGQLVALSSKLPVDVFQCVCVLITRWGSISRGTQVLALSPTSRVLLTLGIADISNTSKPPFRTAFNAL
jgi:hypothetical protein